ncbi:hypothetical protein BC938DRAFT_473064 [Jimgerdemannia flammicorona]|uniref:Uncharacterized protein n=1 Tax=Jimgerdemannia flammicorona TaxID=994334 RepID=A0A433Q4P7_9FUNG|nr:hypothetical protein BC938DRAFT_473064 [Jimgerdemannia flammicorona]
MNRQVRHEYIRCRFSGDACHLCGEGARTYGDTRHRFDKNTRCRCRMCIESHALVRGRARCAGIKRRRKHIDGGTKRRTCGCLCRWRQRLRWDRTLSLTFQFERVSLLEDAENDVGELVIETMGVTTQLSLTPTTQISAFHSKVAPPALGIQIDRRRDLNVCQIPYSHPESDDMCGMPQASDLIVPIVKTCVNPAVRVSKA